MNEGHQPVSSTWPLTSPYVVPGVCPSSPLDEIKSRNDSVFGIPEHHLPANAPFIGLRKSCDCTECQAFSARLSDLQTHENMPSSKQPFACKFPGCLKKFGERSNLKRHQVTAHGVTRTTRAQKNRSLPSCSSSLSDLTAAIWHRV
ncbi:hypothetical protein B0H14DRAFT_2674393 [Mycena olivaceomarginata]|nr:hypothetical protein B0H14DRAFT_2674393 [Mycena olivaceomarginata]